MTENPHSLIDHAAIATAQLAVDEAATQLRNAQAADSKNDAAIAAAWAASVAKIASGGDPLSDAADHAAAVQRKDFSSRLLGEFEKHHEKMKQEYNRVRTMAHVPLLHRGREMRLEAAKFLDAAKRSEASANEMAAAGSRLIAQAHATGLRHVELAALGRGAKTPEHEAAFWEQADEKSREFWGEVL